MAELDEPFVLPPAARERFAAEGFVRLTNVLSPELLSHYRRVITSAVREYDTNTLPLEERDTYGRAFTQVFNLWRQNSEAEKLMRSPRLARIATELLGVDGVRLYHDQALYKEPHGGHTPWHCDQFYWPLSSDRTITAWIPLQAVPMEMGPLAFASGSHRLDIGRHLAISDDSEALLAKALQGLDVHDAAFDLGEVSFHAGWTYHRAGSNRSDDVRAVFTIIYMDENIRLVKPDTDARAFDAKMWCPGIAVGERVSSPINPRLYPVVATR